MNREATRVSSTTVMVPAAWPKSRVDVNTNVSETDILAGMNGSFTVNDPVNSVSAASQNQPDPGGVEDICHNDQPTMSTPILTTEAMNRLRIRGFSGRTRFGRLSAYSPQMISVISALLLNRRQDSPRPR